jgi:hypothetical protein
MATAGTGTGGRRRRRLWHHNDVANDVGGRCELIHNILTGTHTDLWGANDDGDRGKKVCLCVPCVCAGGITLMTLLDELKQNRVNKKIKKSIQNRRSTIYCIKIFNLNKQSYIIYNSKNIYNFFFEDVAWPTT